MIVLVKNNSRTFGIQCSINSMPNFSRFFHVQLTTDQSVRILMPQFKVVCYLWVLVLLIMGIPAQSQRPVSVIAQDNEDKSSAPRGFIEVNDQLVFAASTGESGLELWVTNGVANETTLLADIYFGPGSGIRSNFDETSVLLGNYLYFIARDAASSGEIWRTDGTTEGTEQVTDFLDHEVKRLTLVGDEFYFVIKEGDSLQVWNSTGTAAGTQIVRDHIPGGGLPSFEGEYQELFIFTFQSIGTNDSKVWRSDGSEGGTFPITDDLDGNGSGSGGTSALTQYVEFNDEFYFVSRNNLHKTDGTVNNTQTLVPLETANSSLVNYSDVVQANGKLYFSFFRVGSRRLTIWEVDALGGASVVHENVANQYFMVSNLLATNDGIFFCGANESGGTSILRMDLFDYTIEDLGEVAANPEEPHIFLSAYDACQLHWIGDRVFCAVPETNTVRKGWVLDLENNLVAGVEALGNIVSSARDLSFQDQMIYYAGFSDEEGWELWTSDGTEGGSSLLLNINESKEGLGNFSVLPFNEDLHFVATNLAEGTTIWKYDVAADRMQDILQGTAATFPARMTVFQDKIYFMAYESDHGAELWASNGLEGGSLMLEDINPGSSSSLPAFLTPHQDQLYFTAARNGSNHLIRINDADIEYIKDLGVNDFGVPFRIQEMVSSGDNLYFVVTAAGEDLWVSDGTSNGTHVIQDFALAEMLTDVDGSLFFRAAMSTDDEVELWTSDGSTTSLVEDVGQGYSSEPDNMVSFNGQLIYSAYTHENGRELWRSDGSMEGTAIVKDLYEGEKSSITSTHFYLLNGHVYFAATDGTNGTELWKTDGTGDGTVMVHDINPGAASSLPSQFTAINDSLFFQSYHPDYGFEMWKSDGTMSGTVLVEDINVGSSSSFPSSIVSVGGEIFCVAETEEHGRQLWSLVGEEPLFVREIQNPEFQVFPNPCRDILHLNLIGTIDNLSIYNSLGQRSYLERDANDAIDLSHLSPGLYVLRAEIDGRVVSRKVLKR